jgi:hypothetical protein
METELYTVPAGNLTLVQGAEVCLTCGRKHGVM